MKVEILGSGGAIGTPRPGCHCRVCDEARQKGLPYSRTGPSTFVHGPNLLFDTPEEIKLQLNRAGIDTVDACFYSHWHPDHVMGRRVWEELNYDWRGYPPRSRCTCVYLPQQVAADFRERLGSREHLAFLEHVRVIEVVELEDGAGVSFDGVDVTPFRLAEDYVYAFLLEAEGRRVLLAPDELNGWRPPAWVRQPDLAVVPMGICEFHPLTGERRIDPKHPILRVEATFEETLEIVRQLAADRVVLSHIEEIDGLSYDDLLELGDRAGVEFAYDGLIVDI